MKIAAILNVHNDTELVLDTIDSIRTWATDNIIIVVDGASWPHWGKDLELPVPKIEGLKHGKPSSPYRNYMLGMMYGCRTYPDADWYVYTEYDALFASSQFKEDLKYANENNVWCVGNDARWDRKYDLGLLETISKKKLTCARYLLGCCHFHKGDFIRQLEQEKFFERLLFYTNPFDNGYFPGFSEKKGYDFGEWILPTLAGGMGGQVGQFAEWQQNKNRWGGNYKKYPMRWQPDLEPTENFRDACILHPIKNLDHPIRKYHAENRRKYRMENK